MPEVLDRVLRRDDHEGLRQGAPFVVDRHGAFVHRFEQRRLGLGRGPVDLVGEDDVGEDRPRVELEALRARLEDGDAEHVGRQRVAGELDAAELQRKAAAESPGERRLPDAGHVLDQDVAAREQRDENEVHGLPVSPVGESDVFPEAFETRPP